MQVIQERPVHSNYKQKHDDTIGQYSVSPPRKTQQTVPEDCITKVYWRTGGGQRARHANTSATGMREQEETR